jgi:hypothetical protein
VRHDGVQCPERHYLCRQSHQIMQQPQFHGVEMPMNAFDTQRIHANLPDATGRQESVANMTSVFEI